MLLAFCLTGPAPRSHPALPVGRHLYEGWDPIFQRKCRLLLMLVSMSVVRVLTLIVPLQSAKSKAYK